MARRQVADARRPGRPLGTLALLVLTRVQGVALAPAFVAAVVTYAVLLDARSRRSYLLRFTPTADVLGIGLLGAADDRRPQDRSEKLLAGRSGGGRACRARGGTPSVRPPVWVGCS